MIILFSLFLPILTSFLFLQYIWPDKRNDLIFIKITLSIGSGLGLSSCIFFMWLLVFSSAQSVFIITETAFFLILDIFLIYGIKNNKDKKIERNFKAEWKEYKFLLAGFYISFTSYIIRFLFFSLNNPHGIWDAWAIWNLKSRFLFRGGNMWKNAFSVYLKSHHPDYPSLIPGIIARVWTYTGSDTVLVPVIVSFLFTFATVILLVSAVTFLYNKSCGFLAGIIILSNYSFTYYGPCQYADIPLGFFILSTIVLFTFYDSNVTEKKYGLLFFAGITSGLAGWTKNEGLLFIVVIILIRIIIVSVKGWKCYMELIVFYFGLLLIFMIIIYFKIFIAPPNDIVMDDSFQIKILKLSDFSRYMLVGKAFTEKFYLLFVTYIFLFKLKIKDISKVNLNLIGTFSFFSFMICGYFLVYIISPHDLSWHLYNSLDRLSLHLWPSILLSFFLIGLEICYVVEKR